MPAESYTPGHGAHASQFMAHRTAASHAQFFLKHLEPNWRVLDCGCGPGSITLGIAQSIPGGEVVGVDQARSQIELARQRAAKGNVRNARFETADAYSLPFGVREFDAVLAHALVEHLNRPAKALQEMRRVMRPGGLVGVCSPDWGGFLLAPPDSEVDRAIGFYKRIQQENGGDVYVGRKLGLLLEQAGFWDIALEARYECYDRLDRIAEYLALRIEASIEIDSAVELGWAGREEIERMADALRLWSRCCDGLFAQAWVSAAARA